MKDLAKNDTECSDIAANAGKPALQVICLGNSGGPSEENVTGFLVRSTASNWAKSSLLAVDAGSHLAPITRMLEKNFRAVCQVKDRKSSNGSSVGNSNRWSGQNDRMSLSPSAIAPDYVPTEPEPTPLTSGPFAGLTFPYESARANALHVLRTYIATYLITHPHLDHLSGFAINTAAFQATSKPKTLAALPSTVSAIKDHIFNDIIWPNLTDEDGGVGFVTFQRLKEGGDVMVGDGEGRGYIEVCDGVCAKAFKVSHGTCTKSPAPHQHRNSIVGISDPHPPYSGSIQGRSGSQDFSTVVANRSMSISQLQSNPGTPGGSQRHSLYSHPSPQAVPGCESGCVVDSTAFFLRDEHTQREVLIFGDVEPDSLSMLPRNRIIWQEAARKIAHKRLGGIFIECSYDDSQPDALLFGHLNPKHLIAELKVLAAFVAQAREEVLVEKASNKRKRTAPNGLDNLARNSFPEHEQSKRSRSLTSRPLSTADRRRSSILETLMTDTSSSSVVPRPRPTPPLPDANVQQSGSLSDHSIMDHAGATAASAMGSASPRSALLDIAPDAIAAVSSQPPPAPPPPLPLAGIRVVIIHIKDTMKDGPHVSESILAELLAHEARMQEQQQQQPSGLGCEFIISESGESYWF